MFGTQKEDGNDPKISQWSFIFDGVWDYNDVWNMCECTSWTSTKDCSLIVASH